MAMRNRRYQHPDRVSSPFWSIEIFEIPDLCHVFIFIYKLYFLFYLLKTVEYADTQNAPLFPLLRPLPVLLTKQSLKELETYQISQ